MGLPNEIFNTVRLFHRSNWAYFHAIQCRSREVFRSPETCYLISLDRQFPKQPIQEPNHEFTLLSDKKQCEFLFSHAPKRPSLMSVTHSFIIIRRRVRSSVSLARSRPCRNAAVLEANFHPLYPWVKPSLTLQSFICPSSWSGPSAV